MSATPATRLSHWFRGMRIRLALAWATATAMAGEISFGVIVAFILYVRLFTSPLSTLAQGMTQMQTAAAALYTAPRA